ncbi:MAG: hypothetical protein VX127_05810 [Myxococcota bacterium]|nr:hypothetical protein [Myxococcota bacterium]
MTLVFLAALTGCAPDDATVKGDWFAWLASQSSATVDERNLSFSGATVFECSGRGWNPDTCDYDNGYIGPQGKGYSDSDRFIGGDCPQTNAAGNFNPNDGACNGDYIAACGADDIAGFQAECAELQALEFNTWATDDGYYGLKGDIKPWRTEALLNSEGDLQLTVHIELPADENNSDAEDQDFRFNFSIDPDFEPLDCLENEDGEAYVAQRDGSSWVDEWSEDEDGYRIYYLNAGAYQVNPNDSENTWYLSNDMLSGYGVAKFAAEDAASRPTDYGHYQLDGTGPSFLAIDSHESPDLSTYDAKYAELCEKVGAVCDGVVYEDDPTTVNWAEEMVNVLGANNNGEPRFEHKVEKNDWRPIDSTISGLDGWMEVHSSWVRLKTGQTVAEGEKVEGDFQVLYEGAEGGSRIMVRGTFLIDELKVDRWGYEILEDAKRSANNTPFCNGATL